MANLVLLSTPMPKWCERKVFKVGKCPYLVRYRFGYHTTGCVYLHHWLGDDLPVLHDHSATMVSVGLWGSYDEHLLGDKVRHWQAPWVRRFERHHTHRVVLTSKRAWTLAFAGPSRPPGSQYWARKPGTDLYFPVGASVTPPPRTC